MSASDIGDIELSAWLDGETPPSRKDAVERWLRVAPGAAARVDVWRRQNDILRGRFARVAAEAIPEAIWPTDEGGRREPRGKLNAIDDRDAPIQVERFDRARRSRRLRAALALLAAFVAGGTGVVASAALVGLATSQPTGVRAAAEPSQVEALAARAVDASRTFLRDPARPVEISAANPTEMARYLSRRIGLEVAPPSLVELGPRMLGARLTPGDLGPAGLIVYEDVDGERFGLLISRVSQPAASPTQIIKRRTRAVAVWISRGVGFALAGPNDPGRLTRLSAAIEAKAPAGAVDVPPAAK